MVRASRSTADPVRAAVFACCSTPQHAPCDAGSAFLRLEAQRQAVVAPAFAGGGRAVVEDVAVVAAAARAMVFGARPQQLEVALGAESVGQMRVEAGPAGTAVELHVGREQRQVAAGAVIGAGTLLVVERTGERCLGAFTAQDAVLVGGEPLFPLVVAQFELVDHRRRASLGGRMGGGQERDGGEAGQPVEKCASFHV